MAVHCYDDSTINIVVAITITIITNSELVLKKPRFLKKAKPGGLYWVLFFFGIRPKPVLKRPVLMGFGVFMDLQLLE